MSVEPVDFRGQSVGEYDELKTEIYKLRADLNTLGNKLVASEYGRSSDANNVVAELDGLKDQINMIMQQVAPIEEMHKSSVKFKTTLERMESRLKKQEEIKKIIPIEHARHAWLPVFAIIQLALSWAIFFK